MRKTLSTVLALGLSFALMGRPPADKGGNAGGGESGGGETTDGGGETGGGEAGGGDAASQDTGGEAGGGDAASGGEKMEVDISHVKAGQKHAAQTRSTLPTISADHRHV